jgi:hypothetical protein
MCFVVAVWSVFAHPWGWLFAIGVHPYPAPQTPWTYQLLSGFLPALTVVTLLSLVAGAWRHVNCHQPGCPRFGRHKVSGTPWCDIHVENARPERTDQEILISIEDKLSVLIDVLQDRA